MYVHIQVMLFVHLVVKLSGKAIHAHTGKAICLRSGKAICACIGNAIHAHTVSRGLYIYMQPNIKCLMFNAASIIKALYLKPY